MWRGCFRLADRRTNPSVSPVLPTKSSAHEDLPDVETNQQKHVKTCQRVWFLICRWEVTCLDQEMTSKDLEIT